ncbi:hypothetical protein KJ359_012388 [Pestalotiopsis sp. 9143b]|nr:hypothetical protein KJ359_012388 [Pestalotiopsis sp. 9143b]
MASIILPDGRIQAPLNVEASAPSIDLHGFEWKAVDSIQSPPVNGQLKQPSRLVDEGKFFNHEAEVAISSADADSLPSQVSAQLHLGEPSEGDPQFPLQHFKGAYTGNGFNLIFRPRASTKEETVEAGKKSDNMLQLGFTTEQISFGHILGHVPNRGFTNQSDIELTGVPYMQTIQNTTDPKTAEVSNDKADIHFEPGVWLNVPSANIIQDKDNKDPKFPSNDTIVRMASIPHGTTINAQGFVPARNRDPKSIIGGIPGKPDFTTKENKADSTPFFTDQPNKLVPFDSMKAEASSIFRIPPDLGNMKGKIISTEIIQNPNLVLRNALDKLDVLETIAFKVDTQPSDGLPGGGTANIAFLTGKQEPKARAVSMKASYWVELVNYPVTVPVLPPFGKIENLAAVMPNSTAPTPVFTVRAGSGGNKANRKIMVPGIQIQTSQTVLLDFGGLSWPHISVSTVIPKEQPVVDLDKFPGLENGSK